MNTPEERAGVAVPNSAEREHPGLRKDVAYEIRHAQAEMLRSLGDHCWSLATRLERGTGCDPAPGPPQLKKKRKSVATTRAGEVGDK